VALPACLPYFVLLSYSMSLYLGKQLVLQLISSVMNMCVGKLSQDVNTIANIWPSILHHRGPCNKSGRTPSKDSSEGTWKRDGQGN
jgi:hypothetical protein